MNFASFVTHSSAMAAAQTIERERPIAIDIMRIATSRPRSRKGAEWRKKLFLYPLRGYVMLIFSHVLYL